MNDAAWLSEPNTAGTELPPRSRITTTTLRLSKMKESEITYAELVKRLKKHGFKDETEAGITMKLKRGTFSATFFLACLAAMELEGVVLEEI
jgi:hypothetical protein